MGTRQSILKTTQSKLGTRQYILKTTLRKLGTRQSILKTNVQFNFQHTQSHSLGIILLQPEKQISCCFLRYLPDSFSGIPNCYLYQRQQKAIQIMKDNKKQLVLYTNYRGKIVLPNLNFTNTQLKTAIPNTFTFKGKYPIPQKNLSVPLLLTYTKLKLTHKCKTSIFQ